MALIGGLGFLYIAVFRRWDSTMLTLALIVVCVPLCVIVGILVGIVGYLSPRADRLIITPASILMQTIPTFAYLIPMLLLFGISPVSAALLDGLFATPPMVRATIPGLRKVTPDIKDFADMVGCTARQKLWRVLILGQAVADDRGEPGDHARPQHGHHLLDDRRRRAWL